MIEALDMTVARIRGKLVGQPQIERPRSEEE
jgi:hypothetical protein